MVRSRKEMGRDRAKEKIQAHRKVRLEKKEAKAEERAETERDLKVKVPNNKKKKVKNDHNSTKMDHQHPNGIESWETTQEATSSSNNTYAHYSKTAYFVTPNSRATEECSSSSPSSQLPSDSDRPNGPSASVKEVKNGKGMKSSKAFASGNPNHRDSKPVWRSVHEEVAARKAERKLMKKALNSKARIEPRNLRLQDILKSEELRQLKEILGFNRLDRVCPAVGAVALGRFDLVKKLMNDGLFDLQFIEGQKITPMGCAIQISNWDIIDFLIEKNLNHHCKDNFGNTPLIKAALCPNWTDNMMFDLWSCLKEDSRTDIDDGNKAGVTLIHALAFRGWADVLGEILLAVHFEQTEEKMLSLVNAVMLDGCTPLMLAIDKGHEATFELLLSRGAEPLVEDKAGFTPMCRAMGFLFNKISTFSGCEIPPACKVIIGLLTHKNLIDWDLKAYTQRRLQAIGNPAWDCTNFPELFSRLGRAVFVFILRCLQGGSELLLQLRIFSKLSSIGQKNIVQNDILYTVLGIIFEILVYAEDFVYLWPRYVKAFLREGVAELCLRILESRQSTFENTMESIVTTKDQSSTVSVSEISLFPEFKEVTESLSFLETLPPVKKDFYLAAILPFIQLIDAQEMDFWFMNHFELLSNSYRNLLHEGSAFILSSELSPQHEDRTNRKAILFNNLMMQSRWISPYDKKMWDTTVFECQTVSKDVIRPLLNPKSASDDQSCESSLEGSCKVETQKDDYKSKPLTRPEPQSQGKCEVIVSEVLSKPLKSGSKSKTLPKPKGFCKFEPSKFPHDKDKEDPEVTNTFDSLNNIKTLIKNNDQAEVNNTFESYKTIEDLNLNPNPSAKEILSKNSESHEDEVIAPAFSEKKEQVFLESTGSINLAAPKFDFNLPENSSQAINGITDVFQTWYHDAMFVVKIQSSQLAPENIFRLHLEHSWLYDNDTYLWKNRRMKILSSELEDYKGSFKIIELMREHLILSHGSSMIQRSDLLNAVESIEFSSNMNVQVQSEPHGLRQWKWLRDRRSIITKGYGMSLLTNMDFVKKYLYREFMIQRPHEILNDIEKCFETCSSVGPVMAQHYYVNFEIRRRKGRLINNIRTVNAEDVDKCCLNSISAVTVEQIDFSNLDCNDPDSSPELHRFNMFYSPKAKRLGTSSRRTSKIFVGVDCDIQTYHSSKTLTKPKSIKNLKASVYETALASRHKFVTKRTVHGTVFDGLKITYPQFKSKVVSTKKYQLKGRKEEQVPVVAEKTESLSKSDLNMEESNQIHKNKKTSDLKVGKYDENLFKASSRLKNTDCTCFIPGIRNFRYETSVAMKAMELENRIDSIIRKSETYAKQEKEKDKIAVDTVHNVKTEEVVLQNEPEHDSSMKKTINKKESEVMINTSVESAMNFHDEIVVEAEVAFECPVLPFSVDATKDRQKIQNFRSLRTQTALAHTILDDCNYVKKVCKVVSCISVSPRR